jgi:hypothetical protein
MAVWGKLKAAVLQILPERCQRDIALNIVSPLRWVVVGVGVCLRVTATL